MRRVRFSIVGLALVVAVPILLLLGTWLWFLFSPNTLIYTLAQKEPWPVACSTRGCVTTQDWARQYVLAEQYATVAGGNRQTSAEALTTVIHHHLLAHAFFKSPVTLADARRYREEVLNVHQNEAIKNVVGVSANDYDQYVILPFLEQEALRQEYKVESTEELYTLLSKERFVVSLLRHYRWNGEKAIVESK